MKCLSCSSFRGDGSPGIGPSASQYECSSDDDDDGENMVHPTATFYQNVLGNVNRLLENDNNGNANPVLHRSNPTDTTMYGMTSSNLSFATRQYLQRHGLVNSQNGNASVGRDSRDDHNRQFQQQQQRYLPNPCNPYPYHLQRPMDRILDLSTLKNQPTLM